MFTTIQTLYKVVSSDQLPMQEERLHHIFHQWHQRCLITAIASTCLWAIKGWHLLALSGVYITHEFFQITEKGQNLLTRQRSEGPSGITTQDFLFKIFRGSPVLKCIFKAFCSFDK